METVQDLEVSETECKEKRPGVESIELNWSVTVESELKVEEHQGAGICL